MRFSPLFCAAVLVAGCFAPEGTQPAVETDGTGTGTGTGTTEGAASAETGSSAPSSGSGDEASSSVPGTGEGTATPEETGDTTGEEETGEGDTPPEITALTLNGSENPGAFTAGGIMTLAAEATDDEGLDRIEFFDGDTSLAVVEEPPYETSVTFTSADNGAHTFRAVAYDTVDQSDEESLGANVNIDGGSVIELREEVVGLCIHSSSANGGPLIVVDSDGDVHLVAASLYEVGGEPVAYQTAYRRFDADLDPIGEGGFPVVGDESTPRRYLFGRGALTSDEGNLVHMLAANPGESTLVAFDTTTHVAQVGFTHEEAAGIGVARDGSGNLYTSTWHPDGYSVDGIASDLGATTWSTSISTIPWDLAAGPDYVVIDGTSDVAPLDLFVQKISSDGDLEWTRTVGVSNTPRPAVTVVEPETETIATVFRIADGEVRMQLRDADGATLDAYEIAPAQYFPWALVSDPQGALLVGGTDVGASDSFVGEEAWLARYTLDGEQIWSTDVIPSVEEELLWVSSIAVGSDGATYVAGVRFISSVCDGSATAWIARIEL